MHRFASCLPLAALAVTLLIVGGCGDEPQVECRISADCSSGLVCVSGSCVVPSDFTPNNDPNNDFPNNDVPLDDCMRAPVPRRGELILNEILAAVPSDPVLGDVNGDGVRDSSNDEFLEFVNVSDKLLRVNGVGIFKDNDPLPEFLLETGCLQPGQGLVVFGGLEARARLPEYPGSLVEIATKRLSLRNSGGVALRVEAADGAVLFDGTYPGAEGVSATLSPQLNPGFGFVAHDSIAPDARPFSPGSCADGQPFTSGCPSPLPACPDAPFASGASLLINEVLSAVPTGDVGDANRDGVRDTSDDEFIELINTSNQTIQLKGLRIFKEDTQKATLRTECLAAGQSLVVFAGLAPGAEPPSLGQALVEVTTTDWGLTNGGSLLRLVAPDDTEVASLALPAASGESLVRSPELDRNAPLVGHTSLARGVLFSPGTCADGRPLSSGCPPPEPQCPGAAPASAANLLVNEVLSAVPTGDAGDANRDGERSSSDDEFIELVNISGQTVRVAGVRIFKAEDEKATITTECLEPGQTLVIFAGLADGAMPPDLGEALVEISARTWGLTNGGVVLRLIGPDDAVVADLSLPSSSGESLTRQFDLDPNAPLVGHTTLGGPLLFSPGTCADGQALSTGCP